MKRGGVILLVVLCLGAAVALLSYCLFQERGSPADWLRKDCLSTKNNLLG